MTACTWLAWSARRGCGCGGRSGRAAPPARPVVDAAQAHALRDAPFASLPQALDRNYPNCHLCKEAFTIFNRRHHCRSCGLVFCDKCDEMQPRCNRDAAEIYLSQALHAAAISRPSVGHILGRTSATSRLYPPGSAAAGASATHPLALPAAHQVLLLLHPDQDAAARPRLPRHAGPPPTRAQRPLALWGLHCGACTVGLALWGLAPSRRGVARAAWLPPPPLAVCGGVCGGVSRGASPTGTHPQVRGPAASSVSGAGGAATVSVVRVRVCLTCAQLHDTSPREPVRAAARPQPRQTLACSGATPRPVLGS